MSQRWVPQTPREHAVMEVLTGIRALGDAMDRMHSEMRGDMGMNSTDIAALRMMIIREQRGNTVSPRDIADHLRISTASTTKLLDRLEAAGHITRGPHPTDRRARVLALTAKSRTSFYEHFGAHLRTMRSVTDDFDESELRAISRFLDQLSAALDPEEPC